MARVKRRTAQELAIFSDVAPREIDVDTCSAAQMPVPLRIVNNPAMKKMWDFIVTDMESRRCLSPTYTLVISELVETWHVVHTCRENIDKNGYTFDRVDEEGNFLGTYPNPMVVILNKNQTMMLKLMEKRKELIGLIEAITHDRGYFDVQDLVDRVAAVFVPVVVAIAAAAGVGWSFVDSGRAAEAAIRGTS